MRLVTIKANFFNIFDFPTEMVHKDNGNDRPFLLILSLNYRGNKQSFAIPFRSNIQSNSGTRGTYFPLPTRHSTKIHHAHGLHYIKMFPIEMEYCNKYVIPNKPYDQMLVTFVKKNLKKIIKGAQAYLTDYENGTRHAYGTDIDQLLTALKAHIAAKHEITESEKQIAATDKE